MRRFFCTECKKVKRVRRMPSSVATPEADAVTDRIGQCSFHTETVSRGKVRIVARLGSTRKLSASSQKTKSKG